MIAHPVFAPHTDFENAIDTTDAIAAFDTFDFLMKLHAPLVHEVYSDAMAVHAEGIDLNKNIEQRIGVDAANLVEARRRLIDTLTPYIGCKVVATARSRGAVLGAIPVVDSESNRLRHEIVRGPDEYDEIEGFFLGTDDSHSPHAPYAFGPLPISFEIGRTILSEERHSSPLQAFSYIRFSTS